ncbi:6-phosphogluconolactonase [Chytridiales sp. JEL 0842]|nr:6-phosphogluconolactonase [Chytridiales sp. JEL 0842]
MILVLPGIQQVSEWLNEHVARVAAESIKASGKFTVAVSGGSLPTVLAAVLKSNKNIDWDKWHVFFADERCVPLDHADSNYLLTKKELLDHVPIPSNQVYTINDKLVQDPSKAAADYQQVLEKVFGVKYSTTAVQPSFDLILLGMGPDGHTCSLFPGHPLLKEDKLWVSSLTDSPKPPPSRITLTYPVLNAAKNIFYVTTGAGKAEIFKEIFDEHKQYPAALVKPKTDVVWLLDKPAAALIQKANLAYL